MATALWVPGRIGCIERDSFQLKPSTRTALTQGAVPPLVSRTGDVSAPIEAAFRTNPSDGQFRAFEQWFKVDLANGALPFAIDLWLWNKMRRVRARFQGNWRAQRVAFDSWQVAGAFEIERESIT